MISGVELRYEEVEDKEMAKTMLGRQSEVIYPELFVKFKPSGCFLPRDYAEHYDDIRNMEVRTDDVWVVSLIKSGTTWTQEMSWLLGHDLDYEGAKTILPARFPYLEFDCTWKIKGASDMLREGATQTSMEIVKQMKSPRYIKSHLPLNLLPKDLLTTKPKIIYVARNPKDQCVSYYHHRVLVEGYKGTIDDFADEFVQDYSTYAPYWTHVKEFWNLRNEPNVHFITYESMKKDLRSVVKETAKFLGKSITEEQLEKLLVHLSFESMRRNASVNYDEVTEYLTQLHGQSRKTYFIRKGKVGSWKEEFSPKSIKKLDDWIAKNKVDGIWEDI